MRCFVGCWPDPATRAQLDRLAAAALQRNPRARRIEPHNLHLTLAFIGELAQARAGELAAALACDAPEPFEWCLDRTGRFERARVLWAGGPDSPALARLAQRVRSRLQALHIAFDEKPFAAHVTLLRDLPARTGGTDAQPAPAAPILWRIDTACVLVSERDDAARTRYRRLTSG